MTPPPAASEEPHGEEPEEITPYVEPERKRRRQSVVIGAVVVALVGAAVVAFVFFGGSKTLTVKGQVIDARSGAGVSGAALSVGRSAITSDQSGAFRVSGVKRDSTLHVSAKNYEPADLKASAHPVVRLTPIPVTGVITSAMTSFPLPATLTGAGKPLGAAAADGAFTVYGVGPGDELLVAAPGYLPLKTTLSTNRSLSLQLHPTTETSLAQFKQWLEAGQYDNAVGWLLSPATGRQFAADLENDAEEQKWIASIPAVKASIAYETVRDDLNSSVALYMEVWTGPLWAATRGTNPPMFLDNATSAVVEGEKVWHAKLPNGDFTTQWWRDRMLVQAVGATQAESDLVMAAIIRNQVPAAV
jgi:hypothetical protein